MNKLFFILVAVFAAAIIIFFNWPEKSQTGGVESNPNPSSLQMPVGESDAKNERGSTDHHEGPGIVIEGGASAVSAGGPPVAAEPVLSTPEHPQDGYDPSIKGPEETVDLGGQVIAPEFFDTGQPGLAPEAFDPGIPGQAPEAGEPISESKPPEGDGGP